MGIRASREVFKESQLPRPRERDIPPHENRVAEEACFERSSPFDVFLLRFFGDLPRLWRFSVKTAFRKRPCCAIAAPKKRPKSTLRKYPN